MRHLKHSGFTLAELLISLAILGVIATFTIPKLLTNQQNAKNNAVTKEAMSMVAAAYQKAQLTGVATVDTKMSDLTPYMNYVALDSTSSVDAYPNNSGVLVIPCSSPNLCVKLHNGAILLLDGNSFADNGGGAAFAALDPDGVISNNQDSILLDLYRTGRIFTLGDADPSGTLFRNPDWFSW